LIVGENEDSTRLLRNENPVRSIIRIGIGTLVNWRRIDFFRYGNSVLITTGKYAVATAPNPSYG
jgi:hypothetical protein